MMLSRAIIRATRVAAPRTIPRASVASQTRGYAAPTANPKPPVSLYGVDGTYASALYTAAVKNSSLDSTAKAIASLSNVFQRDPKLGSILSAPTLTAEDKSAIISELLKHTGDVPDNANTVKNFFNTLAEYNRLGLLQSICQKFSVLMDANKGEVELTITSAEKLDNKTLGRLESAVAKSQYVGQGKKLKVVNNVNKDILGGLIVDISGRTIDLSVSSRVAKMNNLLQEAL